MINFLRLVAWMAALTRGSSQAFTVERSMISKPGGSTSASSGIVGPHILRAAVVGHHQRQLQHACGLGQGHCVVLQLSDGNVTHPAVQADLVIDEYHGSILTRETLGKLVCGHRPSSKTSHDGFGFALGGNRQDATSSGIECNRHKRRSFPFKLHP